MIKEKKNNDLKFESLNMKIAYMRRLLKSFDDAWTKLYFKYHPEQKTLKEFEKRKEGKLEE